MYYYTIDNALLLSEKCSQNFDNVTGTGNAVKALAHHIWQEVNEKDDMEEERQ